MTKKFLTTDRISFFDIPRGGKNSAHYFKCQSQKLKTYSIFSFPDDLPSWPPSMSSWHTYHSLLAGGQKNTVYSTGDKTWSGHEFSEHKEDAFSIQHWKLSLKIYHIVHYRLKVQEHFCSIYKQGIFPIHSCETYFFNQYISLCEKVIHAYQIKAWNAKKLKGRKLIIYKMLVICYVVLLPMIV